jgi:hypothetical protein
MGRAELARELGLSTQAVSNIIADLLTEDLLSEKGTRTAGRGLPTALYGLNANGAFALGVEIRPNAVFAALLNLKGEPVYEQRMQINCTDPEVVCGVIVGLREAALEAAQVPYERLVGIGIVMPGPFGQTGLSGKGTDLSGWENVDAQAMFQSVLGCRSKSATMRTRRRWQSGLQAPPKICTAMPIFILGPGWVWGWFRRGILFPVPLGMPVKLAISPCLTRIGQCHWKRC